jgi:hypothetical protein
MEYTPTLFPDELPLQQPRPSRNLKPKVVNMNSTEDLADTFSEDAMERLVETYEESMEETDNTINMNRMEQMTNMYTGDMEVPIQDTDNESIATHTDFFTPVYTLARRQHVTRLSWYRAMMLVRWTNGLDISPVRVDSSERPRPTAAKADALFAREYARTHTPQQEVEPEDAVADLEDAVAEADDPETNHMPECWRRAIAKCALATTCTLEEWEAGAQLAELEALGAANELCWQSLSPFSESYKSAEDFLTELEALEAANESYWQALLLLAPSDMDYSFVSADYGFVSAKEEQEKDEDEEGDEGQEYNPGGQERVEVWLQGLLLKDQSEESEDEDEDEGYESEIELELLPLLEASRRTWLQSPLAKFTERPFPQAYSRQEGTVDG